MNRRGFLQSLIAVPLAVTKAPKPFCAFTVTWRRFGPGAVATLHGRERILTLSELGLGGSRLHFPSLVEQDSERDRA